jgi:sugar O-acyltransferase (sialic acid O-acetyltransferase NeuD family)
MEKLLIFPFNGNGIEALDCIQGQYEFIGFVDDTSEKQGKTKNGLEVFSRDIIGKYKEAKILAVPGSPQSFKFRRDIINTLHIQLSRFAILIHPKASVSTMVCMGRNVLIMAGVVITSNAIIGNHICILPNTVIHHDSSIADYTLIGSNVTVAGNTKIGSNCYIGSGSSIISNIEVGDNTLIGIGTNVIKSLQIDSKVVGNPARQI